MDLTLCPGVAEVPQLLTSVRLGVSGGAVAATARSLTGVVVSLKTSDTS